MALGDRWEISLDFENENHDEYRRDLHVARVVPSAITVIRLNIIVMFEVGKHEGSVSNSGTAFLDPRDKRDDEGQKD